mmetsp:Transcript_22595/g.52662  ORF Transcript_22595/g.52662 Transcript_22595/m.52662 type:complete len:840 (+) Transcript_22595:92-2611(+)
MALSLSARAARIAERQNGTFPVEDPRFKRRGDELSGQYSAAAQDSSKPEQAREAATLFSQAETHLDQEEDTEAQTVGEEALARFKSLGDSSGIADSTRVICQALCYKERRAEATAMAQEQLAAFQSAGDKLGQAKMLLTIAEVNRDKRGSKNQANALTPAMEAKRLFKELGDKKMLATASLAVNFIHLRQSMKRDKVTELDSAAAAAEEALALSKEIGNKKLEAESLHALAIVSNLREDIEQCMQLASEALEIFQDQGFRKQEAFEQNCMAIWYLEDNRPTKALPLAEDALELYQDIGGGLGKEVWAMSSVVRAHLMKRENGKAQKVAKKGATRFREDLDTYSEAYAQCLLMMAQPPEAVEEAIEAGDAALQLFKSMKATEQLKQECTAQVLVALSELNLRANQLDKALAQAKEASESYRELSDEEEQVSALFALISVYIAKDDIEEALVTASDFCEEFSKLEAPREEANAHLAVCQCRYAKKDWTGALQAAKQAQAIFQAEMDNKAEAHCHTVMYDIYAEDGDYEKASKSAEKARKLWKSEGMKEAEANALTTMVQMSIATTRKKEDKGGRSSAASAKSWDKVLKAAKEAVAFAKKLDKEPGFAANSLRVLAETYYNMGKFDDCLTQANEAVSIYRETGDERGEAFALLLCGGAFLGMSEHIKARDDANEALGIFEAYGDEKGKEEASEILSVVNKVLAERQAQMQALQMPQGMPQGMPMQMSPQMQQMPEAGGGADPAAALAARSRPAGGLDVGAGMKVEAVVTLISGMVASIVGDEEDIEVDTPLMQAGLTSNTAVLLRDELGKELPGINLPPTLTFDYPSVQAIADFVMEKASRM